MDLSKVKPSKNIEDRTYPGRIYEIDWTYLLGREALKNQGIDPDEAMKGLDPEDLKGLLFKKALEEFGGYYMNTWDAPKMPQGKGPLINRK